MSIPYHHGDLKQALCTAALELIAADGVASFSLAKAARRIGVSVAAPYRHFTSKADLLATLATQGFEALADDLHAIRRSGSSPGNPAPADPGETLLALGAGYVDFVLTHPGYVAVMFDAGPRPSVPAAGLAALGELESELAALDQAGRLALDIPRALRLTWSLVHGIAMLHLGGMRTITATDRAQLADDVLRPVLTGTLLTR